MADIVVKFDPTLKQSDIVVRMSNNVSVDEVGEENHPKNVTDLQQTAIYGVQCPIIAINDVVIQYEDIINFELNDTGVVPSCSATVIDRQNLISELNTPQSDNEMRVQILPPFEDVYKKIDLTFYISSFNMMGDNMISVNGTYKNPKLSASQFKSLGKISTYEMFETIAKETELGFASNIENGEDKRYMYCNFISYNDLIERELPKADGECMYGWWIDCWNYLNFVDVKDRYETIIPKDDLKLWITGLADGAVQGEVKDPIEVPAELTTLFGTEESQLHVFDYRHNSDPGTNMSGTDTVYSIYSQENHEYKDVYLGNKDVEKDIFTNYQYLGEVYGEYDYMLPPVKREAYFRKMSLNRLEVDLGFPLLGIQRGGKVNFSDYYVDGQRSDMKKDLIASGVYDDNAKTNVQFEEINPGTNDLFELNKSVSGQYMVQGNIYSFSNRRWKQTCILVMPIEQQPKLLKKDEE